MNCFVSSFEPGDPQPAWADTVDTRPDGEPRRSGVDGNVVVGIPGSLRGRVIDIQANGQPNAGEGVDQPQRRRPRDPGAPPPSRRWWTTPPPPG
jgi:hypothetical protein